MVLQGPETLSRRPNKKHLTCHSEFPTGFRRSLEKENTSFGGIGFQPMENEPGSPSPAEYRSSYLKAQTCPA